MIINVPEPGTILIYLPDGITVYQVGKTNSRQSNNIKWPLANLAAFKVNSNLFHQYK
jgi:hypothetical protein